MKIFERIILAMFIFMGFMAPSFAAANEEVERLIERRIMDDIKIREEAARLHGYSLYENAYEKEVAIAKSYLAKIESSEERMDVAKMFLELTNEQFGGLFPLNVLTKLDSEDRSNLMAHMKSLIKEFPFFDRVTAFSSFTVVRPKDRDHIIGCLRELVPEYPYAGPIVDALANIKPEDRKDVIRESLRFKKNLCPQIIVDMGLFPRLEREDIVSQALKFFGSKSEDYNRRRMTILNFLSRIDRSDRPTLIDTLCFLCHTETSPAETEIHERFALIFRDIFLRSWDFPERPIVWKCGIINRPILIWDDNEQFLVEVNKSKDFLMEMGQMNLEAVRTLYIVNRKNLILALMTSDNRSEQIKTYNRMTEVFSGDLPQQRSCIKFFSENSFACALQNQFLDLFLPNMTSDQRQEILGELEYSTIRSHTNQAWQETRDVIDPAERVRIVGRVFHPEHRQLQAQGIVDHENVMNTRRISKTASSLNSLYTQLAPSFRLSPDIVQEVAEYIRELKPRNDADPLFHKVRAGNTEINHALFVLNGERNLARGDFDSLADNEEYGSYRMLGIMGRVWHLIQGQENLLHGFVVNLGQCFDEDRERGPHRVCNIGKVQRLLGVLQGHFPGIAIDDIAPAVEVTLKGLTSELFNEDNSPKVETIDQARALIGSTATRIYENDLEQRASFVSQAENLVELLEFRFVRTEQDEAFAASLAADQKKDQAATTIQRFFRKWSAQGKAVSAAAKPISREERCLAALKAVEKRMWKK